MCDIKYKIEKIDFKTTSVDREGFDHYMLKEIHETPYVIEQVINQDKKKIKQLVNAIKNSKKFSKQKFCQLTQKIFSL